METIHLEFPKQDGILLTKKGLMQISYFKELVVVKPLPKNEKNLALLRNYLKQKLMRELKNDFLKYHHQTMSNLPFPAEQQPSPQHDPPNEGASPTSSTDIAQNQSEQMSPTSTTWEMPPLLTKWTEIVLETMAKDPEVVGRKLGKVELEMKPAIFLGNHPLIHRTVLHRMVRFMRAAFKDHKSEDILVIHREQRPVPTSKGDKARYILPPKDVLLLLPTTLSQSAAHLRFELGTHFCRKCKITMTMSPAEEAFCSCGSELEELRCMGTIHSHGSMSAFSSGTDNKYEIPHIGFHMTVGNLDRVQESLVLSFCDGEVRIPLNISDLFATEKEDSEFDGQINNWILIRREQKKRTAAATTTVSRSSFQGNAFGHTTGNLKLDEATRSGGVAIHRGCSTGERRLDGVYELEDDFEDLEEDELIERGFSDDTLALTRIENNKDIALSRRFDEPRVFGPQAIREMIGRAYTGKIPWREAAFLVRRSVWSMHRDDVYSIYSQLVHIVDRMKTTDDGYGIAEALLDHVRYVKSADSKEVNHT